MGLFDKFWDWAIDELEERGAIDEAAEAGYDTAIDGCGNEGQVSIIEMTGFDAFHEAAEEAASDGSGPYEILMGACPYPEAVSFILGDAAAAIIDVINAATGELLSEDDSEDDEYDDGMDDAFGDGEGFFD